MAKLARNIDPNDEDEPATVQEAINHPTFGKQWEKAIRDEYESLIKNHTWDLVPRPRDRQIVTNKFAFRHKKDERARIVRLKARLVARGFSQIYSINDLKVQLDESITQNALNIEGNLRTTYTAELIINNNREY